ncbi:MAG: ATP-binding protein [Candidatus Thiodiazotropha sp.]
MLIEFSVANYRSICDTQSLSLVAAQGRERKTENSFDSGVSSTPRLLRSAVMYGPNAAGKSNLVRALHFIRKFVQGSASTQRGEEIDVTPFKLAAENQSAPSEFEILFIEDGMRYQYGFSTTAERIDEEWLFAYPSSRAQRWFARRFDEKKNDYEWYFGPSFKGQKKLLEEATRSNALFLSTAVQLNNEQLRPVFDWFEKRLVVVPSRGEFPIEYEHYTAQRCRDEQDRRAVLRFLQEADLGIDGLNIKTSKITNDDLPSELPDQLRRDLIGKEKISIGFLHEQNESGEMIPFGMPEESDGTHNMFALAGPWLDVLEKGMVMVMDELDTSLHPKLVRYLVELMHGAESNPNNAQLIFTTHDVTLQEGVFRRDQIWFVEKDKNRSTHLYPLTDFSPRKGEAIERGYLRGRYGALPHPHRKSA